VDDFNIFEKEIDVFKLHNIPLNPQNSLYPP